MLRYRIVSEYILAQNETRITRPLSLFPGKQMRLEQRHSIFRGIYQVQDTEVQVQLRQRHPDFSSTLDN